MFHDSCFFASLSLGLNVLQVKADTQFGGLLECRAFDLGKTIQAVEFPKVELRTSIDGGVESDVVLQALGCRFAMELGAIADLTIGSK
ncbi:hypothetical protein [Pelagicoccus albus]|uniref:Uncharacterized protein n=1 Tax=Pelagicoccus albus TaxID=415222 RepID=A0A7X1B5N0_9BACT|nr:hypothetical protein [Pelagicoccus albus]